MNFPNASLPEWVWTVTNIAGAVVHLIVLWRVIHRRNILKRAPLNGAKLGISLIYVQKIVLSCMFTALCVAYSVIGAVAMGLPEAIRPENRSGANLLAYVLIAGAIAKSLYGLFDIYMTDRIEEEANTTREAATEREITRDAGRDAGRDLVRDPARDEARDLEHDTAMEAEQGGAT